MDVSEPYLCLRTPYLCLRTLFVFNYEPYLCLRSYEDFKD